MFSLCTLIWENTDFSVIFCFGVIQGEIRTYLLQILEKELLEKPNTFECIH